MVAFLVALYDDYDCSLFYFRSFSDRMNCLYFILYFICPLLLLSLVHFLHLFFSIMSSSSGMVNLVELVVHCACSRSTVDAVVYLLSLFNAKNIVGFGCDERYQYPTAQPFSHAGEANSSRHPNPKYHEQKTNS